jgi:hypothetical protein
MRGDGPGRDDGGGEEAGWACGVLTLVRNDEVLLQYNIAGRPWQHCVERAGGGGLGRRRCPGCRSAPAHKTSASKICGRRANRLCPGHYVNASMVRPPAGIPELLLLSIATASAAIAAVFAVLCFVRARSPIPAHTQETAAPILRSEFLAPDQFVKNASVGPDAASRSRSSRALAGKSPGGRSGRACRQSRSMKVWATRLKRLEYQWDRSYPNRPQACREQHAGRARRTHSSLSIHASQAPGNHAGRASGAKLVTSVFGGASCASRQHQGARRGLSARRLRATARAIRRVGLRIGRDRRPCGQ